MTDLKKAVRQINSQAPIRICDNGGWTDTWFAEYGAVLNVAVSPAVQVRLDVFEDEGNSAPITINALNYHDRYSITQPNGRYRKHPLIEAAFDCIPLPSGQAVELTIGSEVPAACSTGTSASVAVAIIGALGSLSPGRLDPMEVAAMAHQLETELLRQQSGIQDQIAASFGGINFIEMDHYPHAMVTPIQIPASVEPDLESRLSLVYLGKSHNSSHIHEMVIRKLEDAGPEAPQLCALRHIASRSRDALSAYDLVAFGRCMRENTEAQSNLHPELVGSAHQEIIAIAQDYGALGWKVNGAGGDGGSITLLSGPDRAAKESMLRTIEAASPRYRNIPVRLSRSGLHVWDSL